MGPAPIPACAPSVVAGHHNPAYGHHQLLLRSRRLCTKMQIPPTAVGGCFKSGLQIAKHAYSEVGGWFKPGLRFDENQNRRHLNNPPTSVGGIQLLHNLFLSRRDLNDPPTAVGGIYFLCKVDLENFVGVEQERKELAADFLASRDWRDTFKQRGVRN